MSVRRILKIGRSPIMRIVKGQQGRTVRRALERARGGGGIVTVPGDTITTETADAITTEAGDPIITEL